MSSSVTEIHSEEAWDSFQKEHPNKLIVVQFSATWCGPCKKISPFVEKLAMDPMYEERVCFCKIDIDEAENALWEWAMVDQIPTFRFVRDGAQIIEFCDSDCQTLLRNLVNSLSP